MPWPLIRLLPKETHFRFVSLAPFAAALSAIAVIASFASFYFVGLNFGDYADQTGGICKIAIVQAEIIILLMRVEIEMINAVGIEQR